MSAWWLRNIFQELLPTPGEMLHGSSLPELRGSNIFVGVEKKVTSNRNNAANPANLPPAPLVLCGQTRVAPVDDLHFPQSTSVRARPSHRPVHLAAVSKVVIQMIIQDFTMIKGGGGARLHIQTAAQIIYGNMSECFVSRRDSSVTAAGRSKVANYRKIH